MELTRLQQHYIITPVDKAANNVSFICKKYYFDQLATELATPTYKHITSKTSENILKEHQNEMLKLGNNIDDTHYKLPYIYWISKHHKNPTSERYIISGKFCSTKFISKKLSFILKLVQKTLRYHYQYTCKFKNTSSFWITKNSLNVHESLRKINFRNKAKSISTFDFSTLYTSIPHDKLIDFVTNAIDDSFTISKKEYIKVTAYKATWTDTKKDNTGKTLWFDKQSINYWLKFLLDNIYLVMGDEVYQQIIGVPMGTDCAPDLANLFLFWAECKYVMDGLNDGDDNVRKFQFVHRYIDDLLSLNDKGHFLKVFKDIYPNELQLKNTTIDSKTSNFLDLNISIENNEFVTKLYDKRNDFSFKVISMPNLHSNIPIKPAYGVFISQVHRLFNINSKADGFCNDVTLLANKLVKQNYQLTNILN